MRLDPEPMAGFRVNKLTSWLTTLYVFIASRSGVVRDKPPVTTQNQKPVATEPVTRLATRPRHLTPSYRSMILRLSEKLRSKIKAEKLRPMPLDDNPYADWSCHLFTADLTQYILVSNTKSLYSCVLFGKGITNDYTFIHGVLRSLGEFMEDDRQSSTYQKFVVPASNSVRFAKALNRSVTGSMNDLIAHATGWLEYGDIAPHDIGFRLNDTLLSGLATSKSEKYGKPNEAFKLLASECPVGGVTRAGFAGDD